MKNIKQLKNINFIEYNTHKMKIGKEYMCGSFIFYREKPFVTSITRINKNTFIFKTYKKDFQGNLS